MFGTDQNTTPNGYSLFWIEIADFSVNTKTSSSNMDVLIFSLLMFIVFIRFLLIVEKFIGYFS